MRGFVNVSPDARRWASDGSVMRCVTTAKASSPSQRPSITGTRRRCGVRASSWVSAARRVRAWASSPSGVVATVMSTPALSSRRLDTSPFRLAMYVRAPASSDSSPTIS